MSRMIGSSALFFLIFVSGFALMGFEMLGSRYLNPYFGGGITTWACLISVVLFAMMVGYTVGGIVADRSRRIWILSCVLSFVGAYLILVAYIARSVMEGIMLSFGYGFWGTILAAVSLTFLPVALLAGLSPFFVRLLLKELHYGGRVTGAVYGVSTFGNVLGTLVTVFVFIPAVGTSTITIVFGGILIVCGIVSFVASVSAPARYRTLTVLLLGAFLAASVASNASQVPDSLSPILLRKKEFGRSLAKPISSCVARRDTNHPLFHGCIDWHSSVHGNWALFALNKAIPSIALPDQVRFVFGDKNIAKEMQKLEKAPGFEMPYGRAWFLRLAIEHLKAGNTDMVRRHADRVFQSLMSYFDKNGVDLFSSNYSSATWALTNMLDYAAKAGLTDARNRILAQINREVDFWKIGCSYDGESGGFMAICTNVALLASRIMDPKDFRRWADMYLERVGLPTPVSNPRTWHHYGLNFSRCWGLWELYSVTGRLEFADSYAAHFMETMNKPSHWRGSYEGVAHWVAQFGVFALQPLFDVEDVH